VAFASNRTGENEIWVAGHPDGSNPQQPTLIRSDEHRMKSGSASKQVAHGVFAQRLACGFGFVCALLASSATSAQIAVLGDVPDVSQDFAGLEHIYFVAAQLTEFDPATGRGSLQWDRYVRQLSYSFNKLDRAFGRAPSNEFPATEYDRDPVLPFELTFVSPRTVRLRFATRALPIDALAGSPSVMLAGPVPADRSWSVQASDSLVRYRSAYGELRVIKNPWHIEFYDATGRLLTRTQSLGDPASFTPYVPFSFVRRALDLGRSTAAAFELQHDEKLFGAGESFTRLDKRGQKVVAYLRDAMGAQGQRQYKAIPFFLSSKGYGMFVHTSTPVTFDFGHDFDSHNTIYTGDDVLDLFVFLGQPKEVLGEYTALTGRSPVPPLWSFGLWMSRITYRAEDEVRQVAAKLRELRVPADVLHIDTGWFETEWRSNYQFSATRFRDPKDMISDLRAMGFHISLWQLTYFTRKNELSDELVRNGYHVRNQGGGIAGEDVTLDFSNPDAVRWYQDRLKRLLDLGVSVIKADFGEDAPLAGLYASGRTGWYEHNLYPVRYNAAVYDITKQVTGGGIIWGRSAWAGSQRYPVHWGGDAENTNSAMAATLRAGLSLGLSGFTFWSHDIGGFVQRAPRDLYRRWTAFGALTSHTRTHGAPPREPWEYDDALVVDFRRAMELKYQLMPYIYAQAKTAAARGHPLLRPLFFEYPDDPTSWLIEDQYLFGSDLLVAPMFAEAAQRKVYLPPGTWIDYQTGKAFTGGAWHDIRPGDIPIVLLVRSGSAIPHIALAQSTAAMNWNDIELRVFVAGDAVQNAGVSGTFALPDAEAQALELRGDRGAYSLAGNPFGGRVRFRITRAPVQ
jgi:alpha-D-xyloside xylohydrolase